MPDGHVVDMPDKPTSEQLAGLRAIQGKLGAEKPPAAEPKGFQEQFWGAGKGLGEVGLAMATGAVAKPVSEIMGMSAMAQEAMGLQPPEGRAPGFQEHVQRALTYEPRSEQAKQFMKLPAAIGSGVQWAGEKARQLVAPPGSGTAREMLGAGVGEAVQQVPGFVGVKGAPAAAEAAQAGLKTAARSTMTSALKPTLAAKEKGLAKPAVETMLDRGFNVSPGGVEKMQDRISALNSQVAQEIAGSNAIVNKNTVGQNMNRLLKDFELQVNATDDVVKIQKAWDEFLNHPLLTSTGEMSIQTAQKMKQGTYKRLADKYGELGSADIEAQKTLARSLKDRIGELVPKVKPLNAEESELLNALSVSERRVMMEANKNPMGLALLTTSPAKWAAFMADRSGLAKSIIAHMLNRASEAVPSMAVGGGIAGLGATEQAGALPLPPKSFSQAKRDTRLMRNQPELTAISTGPYSDAEKEKRYQEWKKRQEE
jgi:hypothetical protein